MNVLRKLWTDESGTVMSAEMVMLGTVGVLATSAGVGVLSNAVNDEIAEMGMAVRSFDQSVSFTGYSLNQGGSSDAAASTQSSAYIQAHPSVAREHVRQQYQVARISTAAALGARGVILSDDGRVVTESENGVMQVHPAPRIRTLVVDPETQQLKLVD